jgi:hypothetical protein
VIDRQRAIDHVGFFLPFTLGSDRKESAMQMILIILLLLLLLGGLPTWPYSHNWGYFPSGALGLILVVIVLMAVLRPSA